MIFKPKKNRLAIPGLGTIEKRDWTPFHTEAFKAYNAQMAVDTADEGADLEARKKMFIERAFKSHMEGIEEDGQVNMIPEFREEPVKKTRKKRGPNKKKSGE